MKGRLALFPVLFFAMALMVGCGGAGSPRRPPPPHRAGTVCLLGAGYTIPSHVVSFLVPITRPTLSCIVRHNASVL